MSPEARELYLFTIADGDLYRQQGEPIIKNLAKKMVKGIFRRDLAIKLYTYLAANAAKKYTAQFEQGFSVNWQRVKGYGIFSTKMRRETAEALLDHYMEQIEACARLLQAKQRKTNPLSPTAEKSFPSSAWKVSDIIDGRLVTRTYFSEFVESCRSPKATRAKRSRKISAF